MLRLTLFDSGYCFVPEWQVLRGGRRQRFACHALAALLEHPQYGLLLFDTGYAPRMLDATEAWPFRLYRYMTPLYLRHELALVEQLQARGIGPEAIRMLIISHFHADHVAGLRDFPQARIVAERAALYQALQLRGVAALRRGLVPALHPPDLAQRTICADNFPAGPELPHLGPSRDLFGDGSLLLVALPGHARGQLGALVQSNSGPVLLVADGAWTSRSIRELRPPSRLTNLLVDDRRAVATTLARLHAFAHNHPEVRIVPCHCPECFAEL
ncbi:MBL fold metallo-hydrolase [Candidatus Viridilinea mediisalina]|uniref:Metallo-beta-lactamase domain-containing protein n=1 Tax=Candidatus Viridilinea mediisalina TaxID=2024553 RepID=A0A2A6RNF1_9CHLR|nr:MBL fold metallo-hydrolase [Candidatus Viridilinea mediisalina]PDW04567.1 hypothetical protein CJ255_02635 [Candidatus Viridilinea mediisalina]